MGMWAMIVGGIAVMGLFIWQQAKTKSEPLVPLELFRDRNFSVSNIGISTVGFTVTSMSLPLMFFIQLARGLTPTESALLLVPMAVAAGVLSPFAGRLLDRVDPRVLLIPGLLLVAIVTRLVRPADERRHPDLDVPAALVCDGCRQAGMWGPLATTATRNLSPRQAGAGAGIYNTTRTIGSVFGSAAIAAFMQGRLEANLPGMDSLRAAASPAGRSRARGRGLLGRHGAVHPASRRRRCSSASSRCRSWSAPAASSRRAHPQRLRSWRAEPQPARGGASALDDAGGDVGAVVRAFERDVTERVVGALARLEERRRRAPRH